MPASGRLLKMQPIEPIRVRWSEPDRKRIEEELENMRASARASSPGVSMSALRSITPEAIERRKRELAGETTIDPADYVIRHWGTIIAIAYQPATRTAVGSKHAGRGYLEVELGAARWTALVIRDTDGKIVEMDPTTLEKY